MTIFCICVKMGSANIQSMNSKNYKWQEMLQHALL